MVDTLSMNGDEVILVEHDLPEMISLSTAAAVLPSPGTQRALKAQTGHTFDELVGPDADGADRIQTLIWVKLRKQIPGLRWDECADIEVEVQDGGTLDVDPTNLVGSVNSPSSADSGD